MDGAADCRDLDRLAGAVRSLVAYEIDGLEPGEHVGMPSTTLTLVLPTDDRLDVTFDGRRRTHHALVGGLHTSPATIHHGTRQHGVQVAIDPLACRGLLGVPAAQIAGAVLDLDELWGTRADRLLDAVDAASGSDRRRAVVARELRPVGETEPHREVATAWRLILRTGGLIRVDALADTVGWSRRRLEHEFRAELGITPKQACRLRRFERALDLVRADAPLAEAAALAGFTDQPHLTRDWRALAGTTPARWRRTDRLALVHDSASALSTHGSS